MEDTHGSEFCYLHPYIHQVGGHTSMLCLDEATVCKPVVERELQFYESCPPDLTKFTPGFYGVIKVDVIRDGEYITLVGTSPKNYSPKTSKFKRLRFRRSGSLEDDGGGVELFEEAPAGEEAPPASDATGMNPWVIRCHREYLASLAATIEEKRSPQKFLVLENLTWRFQLPCVLDLKVGSRQYDDCDSLAKRHRKMVKAVSTTLGKLGLRVSGMQVYQVTRGRFLCRNKFYGRSLSSGGFSLALREFLHDGRRLRGELIPPLVARLEELLAVLASLPRVRLYTASLLLLYEGHQPSHHTPRSCRKNGESTHCEDSGAVKAHHNEDSCSVKNPLTDVRIIDFAHSTHSNMADSGTLQGPDHGFLFGLENIITMLKTIEAEHDLLG